MVSAFIQNTILSLIVTSITFAVVFLLNYLNKKNSITNEVSRKVVHIGAGTLYLAIYFYNDYGYISKYLNIFPNLLWTGILIWKSQHHSSTRQQHDLVVGTMTRSHRGSELLRGPLFFNFVMIICGTILYKTVLGSIIMGILTWGDGLAAIIGVHYGNQRKIYGTKTLDGLLTIFFAGIIASIIYIFLLVDFQSVHLLKICVISFITAVTETLSPSDSDNLTIPLSIFVMLEPLKYILKQKRIILASGSPQRKQILQSLDLNFEIIVSEFAEDLDLSLYKDNLSQYVIDTAEQKCHHVFKQMKLNENEKKALIIIGADTMCTLNNVVYGKPIDKDDAFRMLKTFSNNTHQVCTGVCILQGESMIKTFSETTDVTFGSIDDETIRGYIETGEPMNKAGGYGIQALGMSLVKKINGDYFNVVGFPVYHFCTQLKALLDAQTK